MKICVVGLGYVGLPLAIELAKYHEVIGYDKDENRINELNIFNDNTGEVESPDMISSSIVYSFDPTSMDTAEAIIVAVPTPVTLNENESVPDFTILEEASKTVAENMQIGTTVIYESTVYPGATEEICIPILEQNSSLVWKEDFFVGYSPERINPGDKDHKIHNIVKVISGDLDSTVETLKEVYGRAIKAGLYVAPSIKVAEASKVIENTQRDVNIGFINECKKILDNLDIDTNQVLDAAKSKWNFLPFEAGLVGGHCIGVDPYYLIHKAEETGYSPDIMKACRVVNDGMGVYHATKFFNELSSNDVPVEDMFVLVLGITFKENCIDVRNTRVISLINTLKHLGVKVDVYDPIADPIQVKEMYDIDLVSNPKDESYPYMILAVKHNQILEELKHKELYVQKPELIYKIK